MKSRNDSPPAFKTVLDWSAYADAGMGDAYADIPRHGGDFAKAVAVCIGSRQCESDGKGVMCPSFRVTGDPALSTGGRVRLLKAALNADLAAAALADPALERAMDLCVSCKGCKRECENNVDMAAIKAEYLAQRAIREGIGWRARLFAGIPRWLHDYPLVRWAIAARNRNRWLARLGERLLGIDARTPLPEPAPKPFRTDAASGTSPDVVLFVDTFSRHFEPAIARDAVRVLEAAGLEVEIAEPAPTNAEPARPLCCGRTYLAQGMVEQAAREARRMLDALLPHARAGRWILGLEPSCLLSLRDDHLTLGLGDAAKEVAARSLLFEEYLAREISAKRLRLPLDDAVTAGVTMVHGHCHQKAVGAMKSVRKVLKLIPGLEADFIDAGCCGMAGTFGLEKEHAELAYKMADQALLPRLRDNPNAAVVANGFSCRQQIRAHTAHRPRHLAEVLADALEGPAVR